MDLGSRGPECSRYGGQVALALPQAGQELVAPHAGPIGCRRASGESGRQVSELDLSCRRDCQRGVDRLLELSDIEWPRVATHGPRSIACDDVFVTTARVQDGCDQ